MLFPHISYLPTFDYLSFLPYFFFPPFPLSILFLFLPNYFSFPSFSSSYSVLFPHFSPPHSPLPHHQILFHFPPLLFLSFFYLTFLFFLLFHHHSSSALSTSLIHPLSLFYFSLLFSSFSFLYIYSLSLSLSRSFSFLSSSQPYFLNPPTFSTYSSFYLPLPVLSLFFSSFIHSTHSKSQKHSSHPLIYSLAALVIASHRNYDSNIKYFGLFSLE